MAHSLPTYRNVAPSPRLSHARHTAATPRASESGHADCALLGPMTDVPFPAAGAARPRRLPEWTLNSLLALCGLALALGLCELLVRLVAPQELIIKRPDVWRPADTLGWFALAECQHDHQYRRPHGPLHHGRRRLPRGLRRTHRRRQADLAARRLVHGGPAGQLRAEPRGPARDASVGAPAPTGRGAQHRRGGLGSAAIPHGSAARARP